MKSDNRYRAAGTPSLSNIVPTSHLDSAVHLRWLQVLGFLLAMIAGASVWILSRLVGQEEPWDSESGYYWIGTICASALGGLLAGRKMWLPILGTYLGQVVYCVLLYHPGPDGLSLLIIESMIGVGVFAVIPSAVGAGIGAILHELCRMAFRTPTDKVAEPGDEREPD